MHSEYRIETPVLFMIFNRLDTAKKVFAEIRKAKPKYLFIASDGPRARYEEKEIVQEVRKEILGSIDWECEVKKLFRKDNLGIKYAVLGAIDWFFEHTDKGIILEDDCLPSTSFFRFCEEMLEKYNKEERIMSISGYNILNSYKLPESYLFSRYSFVWGWATWKRSWKKIDRDLEKFKEEKRNGRLTKYYNCFIEKIIINKRVHDLESESVITWDHQWILSHHIHNSFSIIPKYNLIENIGFSKEFATHTHENYWDKKFLCHESYNMNFPLNHPKKTGENKKFFRKYLFREILRIILKKITFS